MNDDLFILRINNFRTRMKKNEKKEEKNKRRRVAALDSVAGQLVS